VFAKAGRRVLVLEKNAALGGAASVYRIGDLTVEASLHELDGLDEGDTKTFLFRRLGLFDSIEFVDLDELYEVRSPLLGDPFLMPGGLAGAMAATTERFPTHARALEEYFARLVAVRRAVLYYSLRLAQPRWRQLLGTPLFPLRMWPVLRERKYSLDDVLRDLFGNDEAVKLALCAHLCYYADDPAAIWFPFFALAQGSYHVGGSHYPRGGSKTLATRLADIIVAADGEVRTGRRATNILWSNESVNGVEHVDASASNSSPAAAHAPIVFGNAAPSALATMLPPERRTDFLAAYATRSPSISLWTISLGLIQRPREFGVRSWSTVIVPSWLRNLGEMRVNSALLAEPPAGKLPAFIFVDYTHADVGLTPTAPFLGTICGVDRLDNWRGLGRDEYDERRARWMDAMIGALEQQFPGIGGAVVQRDMTTARSIESYLGAPDGAIYGFSPEPGVSRFAQPETPIKGLLLASAYTGFGGYSGSMMGGAAAAGRALRQGPRT
jgi:all-trans-retinol 13,14-reductase